ncbi:MAG: hypothetical protein J2P17_33675, partial [Mycobacterium sp.]|nr:hypothetical protein [Mycobacterium sp.]
LLDLDYHGYRRGYGKVAHSGYHLFDAATWLIAAGERPDKHLDQVRVHTHITRPADTLAQLTVADHEKLFPGFAARNRYTHTELQHRTGAFGEVDAFTSMAYRSGGRTMTLGAINLAHHSFSQRGNLDPALDLYKGNGRIGQETHIIEQGPFQSLHFHCLQTLHDDTAGINPEALGGADHVAVHVFRNNHLRSHWDRHITMNFADLITGNGPDTTRPTQRSARHQAITEFLRYLAGQHPRHQMASDLTTHRRAARLMAATYLAMAQQFTGGPPTVTFEFAPTPATTPQLVTSLEAAL